MRTTRSASTWRRKNPEKLAQLKALFEEQAQKFHLYPLITWDDVLNSRIHRTKTAPPSPKG